MPLGKGHRLNGVVRALEETPAAFTTFSSPGIENAVNLSFTKYDGVGDHQQLLEDHNTLAASIKIAPVGSVGTDTSNSTTS